MTALNDLDLRPSLPVLATIRSSLELQSCKVWRISPVSVFDTILGSDVLHWPMSRIGVWMPVRRSEHCIPGE